MSAPTVTSSSAASDSAMTFQALGVMGGGVSWAVKCVKWQPASADIFKVVTIRNRSDIFRLQSLFLLP